MAPRNALALTRSIVALLVVLAIGVGGFFLIQWESITATPDAYRLDLSRHLDIPQDQFLYHETDRWSVPLSGLRGLAVGADGRICVAGQEGVCLLDEEGTVLNTITIDEPARCVAVGPFDGSEVERIYVGLKNRLIVYDPSGSALAEWAPFGPDAVITSITVAEDIWVADAGNRLVWRLDLDGHLLGRIGDPDEGSGTSHFVIPSPYFDVAAGGNGLVHVVNPGMRRIETYGRDGHLEMTWGRASSTLDGFFGCCNPAHLAITHDGKFLASEKGIPRIKVYSSEGVYEGVVAGPQQLDVPPGAVGDPRATQDQYVYDVGAAPDGRLFVLDPAKSQVRVFSPLKSNTSETDDETSS